MENIKIRYLEKEDLEAIVTIDIKVLGESRKDYWERKLEVLARKSVKTSFVVELEEKVVGFILGRHQRVGVRRSGYDRMD